MAKKPSYEQLRDKWYKKLKETGFEDIETKDGMLKGGGHAWKFGRDTVRYPQDNGASKAAYYSMATEFLNTFAFESSLDQVIWEYHTNGISARNISKLLHKAKVAKMSKSSVWIVINKLEHLMKLQYLVGYKESYEQ